MDNELSNWGVSTNTMLARDIRIGDEMASKSLIWVTPSMRKLSALQRW